LNFEPAERSAALERLKLLERLERPQLVAERSAGTIGTLEPLKPNQLLFLLSASAEESAIDCKD
jgi:hypothetical protein